jgi:hypothetical protein
MPDYSERDFLRDDALADDYDAEWDDREREYDEAEQWEQEGGNDR